MGWSAATDARAGSTASPRRATCVPGAMRATTASVPTAATAATAARTPRAPRPDGEAGESMFVTRSSSTRGRSCDGGDEGGAER